MNKSYLHKQALSNGIEDTSYSTVRYGHVTNYRGTAIICDEDGKTYKAVAHGTRGCAEWLESEGWIEYIPMHLVPQNLQDLLARRNELQGILEKTQDMLRGSQEPKYILALDAFLQDARKAYKILKAEIARQEQAMKQVAR